MTAMTGPRLSGTRPRNDAMLLIETAAREGITYEVRRPWPVYLVNGQVNPAARPLIERHIADGLLHIADPDADTSLVLPTTAGLAKIGATS